jgi:large subunit ribosomal protein L22
MEAFARVRNLRGSARKARLVLDLIRGKRVSEAQTILSFSEKRVAANIQKLLNAAVANAENKEGKAEIERMRVHEAFADEGPIMKRYRPRAHGRATIIRRKSCHITVGISDDEGEE